jgi:hypothetical protein
MFLACACVTLISRILSITLIHVLLSNLGLRTSHPALYTSANITVVEPISLKPQDVIAMECAEYQVWVIFSLIFYIMYRTSLCLLSVCPASSISLPFIRLTVIYLFHSAVVVARAVRTLRGSVRDQGPVGRRKPLRRHVSAVAAARAFVPQLAHRPAVDQSRILVVRSADGRGAATRRCGGGG